MSPFLAKNLESKLGDGKKSGGSWQQVRLLQQQYVQSLFTNIQIHKQIGQFESREAIWKKYKLPITGNSSSCAAVTFSKLKSQPLSQKHIGRFHIWRRKATKHEPSVI